MTMSPKNLEVTELRSRRNWWAESPSARSARGRECEVTGARRRRGHQAREARVWEVTKNFERNFGRSPKFLQI